MSDFRIEIVEAIERIAQTSDELNNNAIGELLLLSGYAFLGYDIGPGELVYVIRAFNSGKLEPGIGLVTAAGAGGGGKE